MIYHIATRAAWDAAQERGRYITPSLRDEGFIHCSTREQVLRVANDFYAGVPDLLLLCIDESQLNSRLRWEAPAHPNPAMATEAIKNALFPHIYGELNLNAVTAVFDFHETACGFELPPDLA